MKFYHRRPPERDDESLHNQKELSPIDREDLQELYEMPKYSASQKCIQLVYFLVFGIPKLILSSIYMLITGSAFTILCLIWRYTGRDPYFRSMLQRSWAIFARGFLFLIGFVRVDYKGVPDDQCRFILTNHLCFFDGWFFLPFTPKPLAKKELFKLPVVGDMLDVYDAIAVDRSKNSGVSKKLIANAADPAAPPITMAPEGATTSGDYMFKFHLGAFLSDVPVQPTAVSYYVYGTSSKISHISFFHHSLWQFLVFIGTPFICVEVAFLKPLSLKDVGLDEPRKFADECELIIANYLGVPAYNMSNSDVNLRK